MRPTKLLRRFARNPIPATFAALALAGTLFWGGPVAEAGLAPQRVPSFLPPDATETAGRPFLLPPGPAPAAEAQRTIAVRLQNVNSRESATFAIGADGSVAPAEARALREFFRCRRTGRHKAMSPRVVALLAAIAQRWPGHVIEVVSGFRAPPFGAPHSKHFRGHAIDLRVPGVPTARVRDFVWRGHQGIGVGHYPRQDFVHLDARPGEGDIAWTSRREGAPMVYNPRWARTPREAPREPAAAGPIATR